MANTERTVYIIELRDRFTMGMNRASSANNRFIASTQKARTGALGLSSTFGFLRAAAAGAATYGVFRLASSMTTLTAKFETTRKAFDVMLGDKGMGGRMFDWAKEFSRTTIITFDQTVTSIRKLLAYGIPEMNIRPLTRALSEISAGVGQDRLPYLTLALGQVYSRGRLMGTELRQFREHGVDIVTEIAKGLGTSTRVVEDMVTSGKVPFDMVAKAMVAMTEEGGRMHGMLEEMAETFTGKFNIMKSTWQIFATDALNPVMEASKDWMEVLINLGKELRYVAPMFSTLGGTLAGSIKSIFDPFKGLFEGTPFAGLDSMKDFVGIGATATTMLVSAFDVVITFFSLATEKFMKSMDVLGNIRGVFTSIFQGGQSTGDAIAKYWESLKDFWGGGTNAMSNFFQRQSNLWGQLGTNLKNLWEGTTPELKRTAFTPTGDDPDGEAEGAAGRARNRAGTRTVGTGARDIIINIGSLIENLYNTNGFEENMDRTREQVQEALLTAINDASHLAK